MASGADAAETVVQDCVDGVAAAAELLLLVVVDAVETEDAEAEAEAVVEAVAEAAALTEYPAARVCNKRTVSLAPSPMGATADAPRGTTVL